ncbi:putative indole-3-pyruvate monooxygenase yucca10 [Quercus suber]|uniref:Indole-3-pyruvate monooxygenase yucca10 n=1 Tax=Quercus suber TaxID=58331 RepID=A0AAW0JM11_QUESU
MASIRFIDVGAYKKIKSGEIQVLPTVILNVRGNDVLFKNGKLHPFDTIVFCTRFKSGEWSRSVDIVISTLKDLIFVHSSTILDEVHTRKSTGRVEFLKD